VALIPGFACRGFLRLMDWVRVASVAGAMRRSLWLWRPADCHRAQMLVATLSPEVSVC